MTDAGSADPAAPLSDAASPPLPWRAAAVCVLLALLWAGTPTAIRLLGDVVAPVTGGGLRFALAAAFVFGWCVVRGERVWPRRGEWGACLLLGGLLFAQIGSYHVGVTRTNASHAALLINTLVIWAAVTEHFVTRDDRLTPLRWIGLGLAAGGAAVVLLTGGGGGTAAGVATLGGDLIVAVSGALLGVKAVVTKRLTRRVPPVTLILWHDLFGAALLLGCGLLFEEPGTGAWTAASAGALLFMGLAVGGFCFAAQGVLLERYSASRVTAFNAATPVFGVGIAVVVLGDRLTPWLFLAAGAVAAGIVLVNRRPRRSDAGNPGPE